MITESKELFCFGILLVLRATQYLVLGVVQVAGPTAVKALDS